MSPIDIFKNKRNTEQFKSSLKLFVPKLKKKSAFTLAEVFSTHSANNRKYAFTLAEVLITLGIIGIVAAMTLPIIVGKYQKQVTVNKLKKINTVLSQIVLQSGNENGAANNFLPIGQTVDAKTTENYFKNCWFPYLNSPMIFPSDTAPYRNIGGGFIKLRNGNTAKFDFLPRYSSGRAMFQTNDGVLFFVLVMS